MQKVTLGETQSGQLGYFTKYFLVFPLSEEEFSMPEEWHIENATRLGFSFEAQGGNHE